MPRYAAFLRGVMPVNAKMSDLKKAFEAAGFTDVKTILGSGNVVFSARAASEASLERRAEAAMTERLGRTFLTIIRPIEALRDLLASDPYRAFRLPPGAKRVVTFLRRRPTSTRDYAASLDAIVALVLELERAAGGQGTVGVGIPGTVVPRTGLVKNANSTWLNGQPLERDLVGRLDRPVRVMNDANCFALSE